MFCTGGGEVPRRRGNGVSRLGPTASIRGEPDCGIGAEGRPTDHGDRFFKACLAEDGRSAETASHGRRRAIYEQIVREQEKTEAGEETLTVRAMCKTTAVSRAGFYRHRNQPTPVGPGTARSDREDRVGLAGLWTPAHHPGVAGSGWKVNGKRVRRIMREDNRLCLRRRKADQNFARKANVNVLRTGAIFEVIESELPVVYEYVVRPN
jgi:hypothetical protein